MSAATDHRSILRICRSLEDRIYAAKGGMERGDHGYAIGHLRGIRALLRSCRFRRDVLDLYHARKAARHG